MAVFDIAGGAEVAGLVDIAVLGNWGFADIVGVVGIVDLVRIEVVGTADIVAATEWQPSLTASTLCSCFCRQQNRILGPGLRSKKNSVGIRNLGVKT